LIIRHENGLSSNFDFSTIKIGSKSNIKHSSSIDIGTDECIEYVYKPGFVLGYVSLDDLKIRIGEPNINLQGLRFKEINIPPNAIIESAHIKLNPTGGYETANATIWCEDSANSLTFIPVPYNLSQRQKTSNSVEWNNIPPWNSSTTEAGATSPDLKTLIQDLIQRPDWTIESPITFLISGSGKRNASSFMATQKTTLDSSTAPRLTVRFSIPDIMGCTDPKACNFSPEATKDDGSCIYPIATCDDGTPMDENCECNVSCDIVNLSMNTTTSFPILSWDVVPDATYVLLYRKSGQSTFKSYSTSIPFVVFFGLDDCVRYEFIVKIICEDGNISKLSDPIYYGNPDCKGLNENEPALKVYPQPATDYITIELLDHSKADVINIFNTEGKAVIEQNDINFDGMVYKADVKHLPFFTKNGINKW